MRIVMAGVFAIGVFGAMRPAEACGSALARARGQVIVMGDLGSLGVGRSPREVLVDQLADAHIALNQGNAGSALRQAEKIIAHRAFSKLTAFEQADAHLIAAHAAFTHKDGSLVTTHYTAAVKVQPKLQKDFEAAQILMATWVRPVAAQPELKVVEPVPETMDAQHWAALAEARYMTHDEEGARTAVANGLKEHPTSEALLDLKARMKPAAVALPVADVKEPSAIP